MNVAVHQHGSLIVVRRDATTGALERVVDGLERARVTELLPGGRDELDEPPALVRAGRQVTIRSRPPDARRGRAQDLVLSCERHGEVAERTAQSLEQQCSAPFVGPQQPDTAIAIRQAQGGDLVVGGVLGAGHDDLQDCRSPVGAVGLSDERLGRVFVGPPDSDPPLPFKVRDQRRQLLEPLTSANGEGLVAHDRGHAVHSASIAPARCLRAPFTARSLCRRRSLPQRAR